MDEKVLEALKGSIKKWKGIVAGTEVDKGSDNCPLCQLFGDTCDGCPVKAKTSRDECGGTPYSTWVDITDADWDTGERKAESKQALATAKNEVRFLKSLLPPIE